MEKSERILVKKRVCETPKLSFHIGPFFSRRPPQWREGSRSHKARQNKRDLGQGSLAESQDFIWHLKGFEINNIYI